MCLSFPSIPAPRALLSARSSSDLEASGEAGKTQTTGSSSEPLQQAERLGEARIPLQRTPGRWLEARSQAPGILSSVWSRA